MPSREWTTKPNAKGIAQLRHEVAAYAVDRGLAPDRSGDVALAVSELLSNAMLHAFRHGGDGTITVAARADAGTIRICVTDDGIGISPRTDSPGAGLGLAIAGQVADSLELEASERGGTAVSLTFAAAA